MLHMKFRRVNPTSSHYKEKFCFSFLSYLYKMMDIYWIYCGNHFTMYVGQIIILYIYLFIYLFILGLHLKHMEVPRLGIESQMKMPAYATATATPDPSHICDLYCSLQQYQILNPLSEARDWTCILMDTSWVVKPKSHNGNFIILYILNLHNAVRKKLKYSDFFLRKDLRPLFSECW